MSGLLGFSRSSPIMLVIQHDRGDRFRRIFDVSSATLSPAFDGISSGGLEVVRDAGVGSSGTRTPRSKIQTSLRQALLKCSLWTEVFCRDVWRRHYTCR